MAKDLDDIRVGEYEIYEENDTTPVAHTWGGIELEYERTNIPLYVDEYGETPIDFVITGQLLTVKATLAAPTEANIAKVIPEGDLITGTLSDKVEVGVKSGHRLGQYAKQYTLHPRHLPFADKTEDITLYKAVSTENLSLAFKFDEQRLLEWTLTALVDDTKGDGNILGRFGGATIS